MSTHLNLDKYQKWRPAIELLRRVPVLVSNQRNGAGPIKNSDEIIADHTLGNDLTYVFKKRTTLGVAVSKVLIQAFNGISLLYLNILVTH